jgi:hypothetical protein
MDFPSPLLRVWLWKGDWLSLLQANNVCVFLHVSAIPTCQFMFVKPKSSPNTSLVTNNTWALASSSLAFWVSAGQIEKEDVISSK